MSLDGEPASVVSGTDRSLRGKSSTLLTLFLVFYLSLCFPLVAVSQFTDPEKYNSAEARSHEDAGQ